MLALLAAAAQGLWRVSAGQQGRLCVPHPNSGPSMAASPLAAGSRPHSSGMRMRSASAYFMPPAPAGLPPMPEVPTPPAMQAAGATLGLGGGLPTAAAATPAPVHDAGTPDAAGPGLENITEGVARIRTALAESVKAPTASCAASGSTPTSGAGEAVRFTGVAAVLASLHERSGSEEGLMGHPFSSFVMGAAEGSGTVAHGPGACAGQTRLEVTIEPAEVAVQVQIACIRMHELVTARCALAVAHST